MKHESTSTLYQYWNRLRGSRTAPDRASIEPADIRSILKDTFILEVNGPELYSFRLAGTRTCSLFTREVKSRNLLGFFDDESKEAMQTLLHATCEDVCVNVVGLIGKNDAGNSIPLEMITLPMRLNGRTDQRILGAISPLKVPFWIGMQPVRSLQLSSLRMIMPHEHVRQFGNPKVIEEQEEAVIPLRPSGSRRIGHLTVFDGGRK